RAGFAGGHTLELWVADARTGEGRRVWQTWPKDPRFTDLSNLIWAGEHLVFQAEPEDGERHRFSIRVDDPQREPTLLTPGEGIVEYVALSPDQRFLYYSSNTGDVDRRHLWRAPVAGGIAVQLTRGDGIETQMAPLASGTHIAVLAAGARQPQSVVVVPADGGSPRVIKTLPDRFPAHAHVVPQNVV